MSDYIEWDGTEKSLNDLLIWWGSRIPWKHSPECTIPGQLHCCDGISEFESKASISGRGCAFHNPLCIDIEFSDGKSPAEDVEPGDRIYYRGHGVFELVKKPNPMPDYSNYEDHFVITGRGHMFTSGRWKMPEGYWEPWDLYGRMAMMNGHEVRIKGVEAFCSARSPSSPYRHSFGILLSEEDAEKVLS